MPLKTARIWIDTRSSHHFLSVSAWCNALPQSSIRVEYELPRRSILKIPLHSAPCNRDNTDCSNHFISVVTVFDEFGDLVIWVNVTRHTVQFYSSEVDRLRQEFHKLSYVGSIPTATTNLRGCDEKINVGLCSSSGV